MSPQVFSYYVKVLHKKNYNFKDIETAWPKIKLRTMSANKNIFLRLVQKNLRNCFIFGKDYVYIVIVCGYVMAAIISPAIWLEY